MMPDGPGAFPTPVRNGSGRLERLYAKGAEAGSRSRAGVCPETQKATPEGAAFPFPSYVRTDRYESDESSPTLPAQGAA